MNNEPEQTPTEEPKPAKKQTHRSRRRKKIEKAEELMPILKADPAMQNTPLARQVDRMMKSGQNTNGLFHLMATRDAGSVDQFVDFLFYCVRDEDGKIDQIIDAWKSREKNEIFDDILARLDVNISQVYEWAGDGARRKSIQIARFKMAGATSGVIERHIQEAQGTAGLDRGFRDRHLFSKISGILPTSTGTKINVNQTNLNNAQSKSDSGGTSMPNFEAERRVISEAVRVEEE